jgi:hypothetical protein
MGKDLVWLAIGAVFLCFILKGKKEESPSFKALGETIEKLKVGEA